jgi:DNA-binding NarL/FixJ family response regulator
LVSRILIADDNAMLRTTLKAFLETHAEWYVCGEAANGLEAVQKAAELKPDLLILDFAMPEMNGLQAASQISSAFPNALILLYTNYAFPPEAKLDAMKSGVRQIINKGASPGQLISAVETLLKEQSRSEAEAASGEMNVQKPGLQGSPQGE